MSASDNKIFIQNIFDELSKGNTAPFVESFADDFRWTIKGSTKWSKTYEGKEAVMNELLAPLFRLFADQYTNTAQRLMAEDDLVVVECRGRVTTKKGEPYNNNYCYIIRVEEGKMRELTEYLDTALVDAVLDDKKTAQPGPNQDSVGAILKLYELRRDEKMRAARAWYFSEFAPKSVMDIIKLYRDGEQPSAFYRMITSYWDMASSFVLNGGIDEKMFLDAGTEYIFVYAKIQPFLTEIRQMFQEPDYLLNLETLVRKVPEIEAKLESRKRLISIWTKEEKEISAGENA